MKKMNILLIRKIGAWFKISLIVFLVVLVLAEIFAVYYGRRAIKITPPANLGNSEKVIAKLPKKAQDSFSFAVIGDTEGCGTLERILRSLKDESLSFVVFVGDLVRRSIPGEHQYLQLEINEEDLPDIPLLYIAGNHDIDEKRFPLKKFEELYGPTNFSFEYMKNLFVGLRILKIEDYSTQEALAYLDTTLTKKKGTYKKVFVFFHIPPPISDDFVTKKTQDSDKLMQLLDKHKVDYVFTGDYHGYQRKRINSTNYIVTGGGGAHLFPSKFGHFHHCMVIEVDNNSVTEKIFHFDRSQDFKDIIEHSILTEIYPWMLHHPWAIILANIVILISLCMLLRKTPYKR